MYIYITFGTTEMAYHQHQRLVVYDSTFAR